MHEIFINIYNELKQNRDVVLVELISSSGSTPRGAGAKMLVFSEKSDKNTLGTIGGGRVEFLCTKAAKKALNSKTSFIKGYDLSINDVEDVGMICGGNVEACFKYFSYEDIPFVEYILKLFSENKSAWLITKIEESSVVMGTYDEICGVRFIEGICTNEVENLIKNRYSFEYKGNKYFIEPISQKGKIYVFGAGHVSRELVPLIQHLGFNTVVYEQRKELIEDGVFPDNTEIYLGEFSNIDRYINMKYEDYAVIMTSGHKADFEVLEQVLRKNLSYVGVIGSKSKIAITRNKLIDAGVEIECIEKLHTPIGIAIKAETPEEIAVSIAAELILHRAKTR